MAGYGRLIVDGRERRGWTQGDLAERLGVSVSTLSRWESEIRLPDLQQVNALVVALGLSAEDMIQSMGLSLLPPMAARLPRELVLELLQRGPEELDALLILLRGTPPLAHRQPGPQR